MSTSPYHLTHMTSAIQEAIEAARHNEVPVGAVLVNPQGQVVARACNQTLTLKDPTAHAEILVIRDACRQIDYERLLGYTLYVTLEPCAMCASAISQTRIQTLFYGASDPKSGGVEHGARVFSHPTCHHRPEVVKGIMGDVCGNMLTAFFRELRQKRLT